MIPYGRQCIDDNDIQAVIETLRSDFITTGPKVAEFEQAVADYCQVAFAVAVSNGTAALHTAVAAAGVGPGDEVIVSPMTFVASANSIVYCGGTPVFADVLEDSLLIDPESVEARITDRTKAIVAVDYAGQPCDYDRLAAIAGKHNLVLIDDAAHAIGAEYKGRKVGSLADLTTFSFHPVKHITTGEGGMIMTDNREFADQMRIFRNHGITTDYRQRQQNGQWFYEMDSLGFNYRITDFQCALGISQLSHLDDWVEKRQGIAAFYDRALADHPRIISLKNSREICNAYHLYVVKLDGIDRNQAFERLRDQGIGVNIHYIPVHFHPYYRRHFQTHEGMCPVAERAFEQILTLPVHPGLSDEDLSYIVDAISDL